MNSLKENLKFTQVLIIGSGIVGKFNALELAKLGLKVLIIDPCQSKNSSNAALGILMGKIYQKRNGRSWELRKTSMKLWPDWLKEFKEINPKVDFEKPLIKMTTNDDYFEKMKKFVLKYPNDNLKILQEKSNLLVNIQNVFNNNKIKGIISYEDGRINPKILLNTIDSLLKKYSITTINNAVFEIKKDKKSWIAFLKGGNKIVAEVVILCNSLKSLELIESKKYNLALEPVLGQAIEISIKDKSTNFLNLPKVFSINGKNIIPLSRNKLIIGSTDEFDTKPQQEKIKELTEFIKEKPNWLDTKNITKKWFGIRSKPIGEGSPLLKSLETGLILCTGFYKNGILLAPASSKWVSQEVQKYI